MPIHLWTIPCQHAITDKKTNLISHINVIEGVSFGRFPQPLPPLTLASAWQREDGEEERKVEVRYLLQVKTGKVLHETKPESFDTGKYERFRFNHVLRESAPIDEPCVVLVKTQYRANSEWETVSQQPIEIKGMEGDNEEALE